VQREDNPLYRRAIILLDRLERLSADSTWAHRASGLRGSIIRALNKKGGISNAPDADYITGLVEQGYEILNKAAGEIPGGESDFFNK
jgi:hypothetical protein